MKRTLLTGIAVLFLVTGAAHAQGNLAEQLGINDIRTPVAETGNQLTEPPKEYDHEYYRGKLIVKRTDERGIKLECWTQSLTGCAFFVGEQNQDCLVWIVNDDVLSYQRLSYDVVFRHERAHCNGWHHLSSDHHKVEAR